MPTSRLRNLLFVVLLLALSALIWLPQPAAAASVEPVYVSGNPRCADFGYPAEYKVDPPNSGTYNLPGLGTVTITADGPSLDWSSTIVSMDAVIVKGGPNANVYTYDPPAESLGDTGLHAPINPNNNKYYGLSHVTFCFDYELSVTKTAAGRYDRTITWMLEKSVDAASHSEFAGAEAGVSTWQVMATKTVVEDNYQVSGDITIANPAPKPVEFRVADFVDGVEAVVTCDEGYTIPARSTRTCSYIASTGLTGAEDENTVTVTSLTTGVGGDSYTEPFTYVANVIGDESITVDDDRNPSGFPAVISESDSWSYGEIFTCSGNPADYTDGVDEDHYPNTATATGNHTDLSADAEVTVTCYAPTVDKTAYTTYDRAWTWTVAKSADQSEITLSVGQQLTVNYTVEFNATSLDDGHMIYGDVTVSNPHPSSDMTINLKDEMAGVPVSLDCGEGVDPAALVVTAAGSVTCTYSVGVDDATERINIATATLNGIDFTDQETATFGDPANTANECVVVADTFPESTITGTLCAPEDIPATFTYARSVGPYEVCGEYTVENTVSFTANDMQTPDEDTVIIPVHVLCDGCTLTPGYWKTHSTYGPAPYEETWALLGEDTTFFLSGQSYYEVLWTPPAGGNAYYILAHAYIAAELNFLNGAAVTPEVDTAFTAATDLFDAYTPAQVAALQGGAKETWTDLATILDNYNNGDIGPGHCSWDTSSPADTEPTDTEPPDDVTAEFTLFAPVVLIPIR